MRTILHIDFNSYFASVEQQANPRLRGKPIGVTGGDRMKRTVLGAASVEAKKFGVKTGMQIWEAKRLCPQIILVRGDSDKYLETTKRFLGIISSFSSDVEVFSIDEVFMELSSQDPLATALDIKRRIKDGIGEYVKCSIGISYNKLLAKLAGSLQKPDGLVVIKDQAEAIKILDKIELDEICGIGGRTKKKLNNMGIFNFYQLRKIPLEILLVSFKSYGKTLYNWARGLDYSPLTAFYEKGEVKSIGHRHTIDHDTSDSGEIKQILLKLTELIARRLRSKKLVGKTISCYFRYGLSLEGHFTGDGMQATILPSADGLEIFNSAWKIFLSIWSGERIRMIGVSISNLQPITPQNLSLLPESQRTEIIIKTLDKVNDRYGEFTLQRGILLGSSDMKRKSNPFLADRRFKL